MLPTQGTQTNAGRESKKRPLHGKAGWGLNMPFKKRSYFVKASVQSSERNEETGSPIVLYRSPTV